MIQTSSLPAALPAPAPFEEAAAAEPQDMAATLAFALARALETADLRADSRPVAFVTTPLFQNERGRLCGGAPGTWACRRSESC